MNRLPRTLALIMAVVSCCLGGTVSLAQTLELRAYRVTFPAGSVGTTIRETIEGRETILYRISARKGQVLQVTLDSTRGTAFFSVYGPGRGPGDTPIAASDALGQMVPGLNRFQGTLARDGDHTVAMVLTRSAASQLPEVPGAGKPVIATGTLSCVLELIPFECRYPVTRRGAGDATLSITRPFARDRVIEFLAGRPVSSNASEDVRADWKGPDVIVSVGRKESFTVPNAVLFGR